VNSILAHMGFASLASLAACYVYFVHLADVVGAIVGYPVATFLVPAVSCFLVGAGVAFPMPPDRRGPKLVLLSGAAGSGTALLVVAWLLWAMSRPH
jgi:hypothetical protein